jgi:hypothetical protein
MRKKIVIALTSALLAATAPASVWASGEPGVALGEAFLSNSAGLTVQPPGGMRKLVRPDKTDEVMCFIESGADSAEKSASMFIITRVELATPIPFQTEKAINDAPALPGTKPADKVVGFLEQVVASIPTDGKAMLRQELIPIDRYSGAMLASAHTVEGKPRLFQQAVIRRTDRLYYLLTYTTPRGAGDPNADPQVHQAVAQFNASVETFKLLDQEDIRNEQNERLFATRALFVNWSPAKVTATLNKQQWFRIVQNGKDVGFSYIVEETANDLPRKTITPKSTPQPLGFRVGVRSRLMGEAGQLIDTESWFWTSFDREQETFSNLVVFNAPGATKEYALERAMMQRVKALIQPADDNNADPQVIRPERATLNVWINPRQKDDPTVAAAATLVPLEKQLPKWYLPQALGYLLPRLVDRTEPKQFLFASYVSDAREVMSRYVDVLPAAEVKFNGKSVIAIAVKDRIGYEGTPTYHYFSPEGAYLGSATPESGAMVLPTDEATLKGIWKDATISRPGELEK